MKTCTCPTPLHVRMRCLCSASLTLTFMMRLTLRCVCCVHASLRPDPPKPKPVAPTLKRVLDSRTGEAIVTAPAPLQALPPSGPVLPGTTPPSLKRPLAAASASVAKPSSSKPRREDAAKKGKGDFLGFKRVKLDSDAGRALLEATSIHADAGRAQRKDTVNVLLSAMEAQEKLEAAAAEVHKLTVKAHKCRQVKHAGATCME